MVTFALPGDYDAASETSGTPKSRPPLPFAKRTYAATPYATKRFSTPQSSARKAFTTRDEVPSSSLNHNGMPSSRNIFKASTAGDSPSVMPFSPSLPQSTMKKVFAPGVTPEPTRVYREYTAKATPRGIASHASEKELFSMRIASPPPELTGEVLANKVPEDSNGAIYADQFLSHLCPPDLDDEQRRQFFCILDLRRLKYAANEIFVKKNWKLNIINFAKEFEKSRSIILLRYGLYEFQNVKPSKEVLKRWRREHGLPDPMEDDAEDADPTPTKPAMSKKRKANDNFTRDSVKEEFTAVSAKRRVTVRDEADEPAAVTPAPSKNKRRGSLSESDEQPSKQQKGPSSAKSLFEKIASKSSPAPAPSPSPTKTTTPSKPPSKLFEGAAVAKSSLFGTEPVATPVATSVLSPSKLSSAAGTPSSNIFGYLSDTGSAKNSAVDADADAESESETDSEQGDSQEVGQGDDDHSGATSGTGETDSQSSLFNAKPETARPGTGTSSGTGTRESTPGRSLFDRVTKDNEGQPLRASQAAPPSEQPASTPTPLNQTWNPNTSPIKFAPKASAATDSLFGLGGSASSSLFGTKNSAASNLFGPPKSSDKDSSKPSEKDANGGESDKENESRPSKKTATETRPALQPNGTTSLFSTKPGSTDGAKETGFMKPATSLFESAPSETSPPKPAANLFSSTPKETAPLKSTTSLFGSAAKPDASTTPSLFGPAPKDTPTMPSSTLFGAKPVETVQNENEEKNPEAELPKTNSLFGVPSTSGTPANLFTPKPATNGTPLFGGASSTPSTNLFGSIPAVAAPAKVESTATSQPAAAPLFSFGASVTKPTDSSQAAAASLFGAPKSPQTFDESSMQGSPMNQDQASPTKKPFNGTGIDATKPPPIFSFGAPTSTPASSLFGSNATPAASMGGSSNVFGGSTTAPSAVPGPASFNFNFGGPSTSSGGTTLNNPFASATTGNTSAPAPAPPSGNLFSFGASSTPSGGSGGMFQFGGSSSTSAPSSSAPIFGGASSTGGITPNASQPSSTMFTFGGNQAPSGFGNTLQPPAGGSSTTGTNSPFNLGGGSSLATTPAGGTPEPSTQAAATPVADNNDEDGEKHEQISLTDGVDKDEDVLYDVRAKVLKFVSGGAEGEEKKAKSKSPWVTQGLGPLRLLKHKETNAVRLLLRAEPRGNVALNKLVLPNFTYKSDEKYVKVTTSNDVGDGLETWMLQVKTKDSAKALAEALEKNKDFNKKA